MKSVLLILCLVTALMTLHTACEEDLGCQLTAEAPLRAGFFTVFNDTAEIDTTLNDFSIKGLGSDSLLFDSTEASTVNLPLNPFADQCGFIVTYLNVDDTLNFSYTRHLELFSEECGFFTTFDVSEATTTYHGIDSIALIESKVNTENVQHVKIYF